MKTGVLVLLSAILFTAQAVARIEPKSHSTLLDAQCDGQSDGTPCEDGSSCTLFDACENGECTHGFLDPHCYTTDPCFQRWCDVSPGGYCRGAELDCNDNYACTVDDCSYFGGCYSTNVAEWEMPPTVRFANDATLTWDAYNVSPSQTYDVVRGTQLPVGAAPEACLASSASGETLVDAANPSSGVLFWYLVRAGSSCGGGRWGRQKLGTETQERATASCPH